MTSNTFYDLICLIGLTPGFFPLHRGLLCWIEDEEEKGWCNSPQQSLSLDNGGR